MRETNRIWELSRAHEESYYDKRNHVAEMLIQWGSTHSGRWPERARFIAIHDLHITPAWVPRLLELGKGSITRTMAGWKLSELFPQREWYPQWHDVFFAEATQGNVNKGPHAPALHAYISSDSYFRVISLGCDHSRAEHKRGGQSYVEYSCPDCSYTWGVDTSD